ncbi:protocadherin beta-15-like [Chiloscyllium punctatum]|uniref:protocadherin beta-15-like n=1 Tax=Chiloscyllium punctatum TaxID=137246 RepID=UPI003B632600
MSSFSFIRNAFHFIESQTRKYIRRHFGQIYNWIEHGTMAKRLSRLLFFVLLTCVSDLIFAQIQYVIPEEMERGAVVGNIAEDLGLSIGEMSFRKFRLVTDDRMQLLKVNKGSGILIVNERIDREMLCGQSATCSISQDLAVDNPLEMYLVDVEILDVNDNSPTFPKMRYAFQVSELTAAGALFPLESAHDADVGTNAVSNYEISTNKHFGMNTRTRSDGSKIAELVLENPLDREQHSSFHLTLTAIDGGIPRRSGTAEIVITVLDGNDNAPVFDHQIYNINALENIPVGTVITTLHAVDLDQGTNGEVRYYLTNYVSHRVRELFNLNPETGQISVQGSLDYEEKKTYQLDVEAVDNGTPALVGRAEILVELVDVNDNAPDLKVNSLSIEVSEGAAGGTVIAIISATDRDSGENGHVQCHLPPNIPFKLQKSLNWQYNLIVSDRLNRESTPSYNISISAWDAGSPPLSTNKTIHVSVSDINDNAPQFTQLLYNVFLMENNVPGASVFAVTALDADLGKNSEISYSLLDSFLTETSASGQFIVNSESGRLHALRSFDYEIQKNFQIKVQARDSGTPSLSSTALVNVIILDQNDNAPVIVSPSNMAIVFVPKSAHPGYLVTKVIATDADSGQNAKLSFQLLEATDHRIFSVEFTSGEITTTQNFREQVAVRQAIAVLVRDNGQPSLSSTVSILCTVQHNVTENTFDRKYKPRNPELFSDLNFLLIIIFGSTSCMFLFIICFLVVVKYKQDKNIYCYTSRICCHGQRNSTNASHCRDVAESNLDSVQTLPVRDSYNYTVCLSPESSKSDFLFLKPSHPTLPLDGINIHDTER